MSKYIFNFHFPTLEFDSPTPHYSKIFFVQLINFPALEIDSSTPDNSKIIFVQLINENIVLFFVIVAGKCSWNSAYEHQILTFVFSSSLKNN